MIDGVAGPHVKRVSVAGAAVPLSHRVFIVVLRGRRSPAATPVDVTYADGTIRNFAG